MKAADVHVNRVYAYQRWRGDEPIPVLVVAKGFVETFETRAYTLRGERIDVRARATEPGLAGKGVVGLNNETGAYGYYSYRFLLGLYDEVMEERRRTREEKDSQRAASAVERRARLRDLTRMTGDVPVEILSEYAVSVWLKGEPSGHAGVSHVDAKVNDLIWAANTALRRAGVNP